LHGFSANPLERAWNTRNHSASIVGRASLGAEPERRPCYEAKPESIARSSRNVASASARSPDVRAKFTPSWYS
jgi:hypothetical protein